MSKQTSGESDELLPFPFIVALLSVIATLLKFKLKKVWIVACFFKKQ